MTTYHATLHAKLGQNINQQFVHGNDYYGGYFL